MPTAVEIVVESILVLAACVWLGGFIAIMVVARVSSRTMEPAARVSFFRGLGRAYLRVGVGALVVAYLSGAALLAAGGWGGLQIATVVVAAGLLIVLAIAVRQARRMTKLRARAAGAARQQSEQAGELTEAVQRGGQSATLLRALLGLLSIALVVLGVIVGR